jgi:hypothetical protein
MPQFMSDEIKVIKERFEHVLPQGTLYAGYNYTITIDDYVFLVRCSDHDPGVFSVTSPRSANELPQSQRLKAYLQTEPDFAKICYTIGSRYVSPFKKKDSPNIV